MTAGLSNEANALLERAKNQGGPTAAQTAKIGAAVFAATTASAATATAAAAGTVATTSSFITIVGAGLVATALGIGGTVAVKHALAPPREQPRARATSPSLTVPTPSPTGQPVVVAPVAAPSEPVPEEPATEPKQADLAAPRAARVELKPAVVPSVVNTPEVVTAEPTPDVPAAPPPRVRNEAPLVDSTAAQVAALTAAVEALEHHQPEVARATAHDARLAFPRGVLSPELMVVEITALCELGRRDDALTLSHQMTSAEQTPLVRGKLGRTCVGSGE